MTSLGLKLKVAILDRTKDKVTNLFRLASVMETQLKRSYQISYQTYINFPISKFNNHNRIINSGLDGFAYKTFFSTIKKTVNVSFFMKYRIVRNPDQKMNNEHLIQIMDNIGEMKNLYGFAHNIGGSTVSLNVSYVNNIIQGLDNNTIPHELGHTFSLLHVDDQSTLRSDSRQYWTHAKQNTKDSTNIMFSGGSKYNTDLTSTTVVGDQINLLINAYRNGKLNLN
ncbi:hypothetical protein ASE74_15275 [Pedobacter sp. Leaf216]|nr:hypothetical protein ASE74_15275 [Pedobacter sp. Leaf216]